MADQHLHKITAEIQSMELGSLQLLNTTEKPQKTGRIKEENEKGMHLPFML